jgi:hypothetical protein
LMARDAVMGATPASMATSRKVMAPLLRRERLGCSLSVMKFFVLPGLRVYKWYRYHCVCKGFESKPNDRRP